MRGQELDKCAASSRAMRSASPTLRMAAPSTKPLSTSQNADDRKPVNTASAGATCSTMATVKNISAVRYSGSQAVAHSRIVAATRAAGSSS